MASSRPSASSRDLLVELHHGWHAPLWPGRHWERPQTVRLQRSPLHRRHHRHLRYRHLHRRRSYRRLRLLLGLQRPRPLLLRPPALNTAPSSPLDDASVASDELHCGPLFGSSDEEAEEGGSYGPHAALSGLFDYDSDGETVPVGTLNRLKHSVDSGDKHPYALPSAPAKNPANGLVKYYDPAKPWNYSAPVNIEQLHDVCGYPLQLSWVWEEQLGQRFARRMDQVMQWRDDLCPGAFAYYYKKYFARRDQASPAGGCFMDGFRAALYHLGGTGLAATATELWVDFVRDHPSIVDGVSRAEATEFFRGLQRNDFPLDYDLLFQSPPDASYTNVERFQTFVQTLREGVYLTSIGDGFVGHCVVVLAKGPDTAVSD
ncbi:hypothetical protein PInf_013792 [Phytophthora infestans]|nr:hypothetical protein PInf_013792 [Phytophthora infestans]